MDSTSGTLKLPVFEADKTYLLKGETLTMITDVIKENKLVLTGSLQFLEVGPEGSKLQLDVVELSVCIDGVVQTRRFLTATAAGTGPAE